MIEEAFETWYPTKNKVSKLVPNHLHREPSLIRSIMSKYQYQLKVAIESSLKEIDYQCQTRIQRFRLYDCDKQPEPVDECNLMLARIDGSFAIGGKTTWQRFYLFELSHLL